MEAFTTLERGAFIATVAFFMFAVPFSGRAWGMEPLPPGGTPSLAPDWPKNVGKKKGDGTVEIKPSPKARGKWDLDINSTRQSSARKPLNCPVPLTLVGSNLSPNSTVVIRFMCRGDLTGAGADSAFVHPPEMTVAASYGGKNILGRSNCGYIELTPHWTEFKVSFKLSTSDSILDHYSRIRKGVSERTGEKDESKRSGRRGKGKSGKGTAGRRNSAPLKITLYFGYIPEKVEIKGLEVVAYPPGKLDPNTFLPPLPEGNSMVVFQNKSRTIDVIWNDMNPAKRKISVVAVTQPAFGKTTFSGSKITYRSTKPHEYGYDYFHYTVSDDKGNKREAPVKVLVTPDFFDGTWNVGHDSKHFPNAIKTAKGHVVTMKRFVCPTAICVSRARIIGILERMAEKGELDRPLERIVFPFAKKGPNGEDTAPFGVFWDLPHEIDSNFCLPIMNTIGVVVDDGEFKGPHTHQIRSFPFKFKTTQMCINPKDLKTRFFFKTQNNVGDVGMEFSRFQTGPVGSVIKSGRWTYKIVEFGGKPYKVDPRRSGITSKDTDGDGFPDKWFEPDGKPLKNRINGARSSSFVEDPEHVDYAFDMKDYFDWAEKTGWTGGGEISYLFNGSEMGSSQASSGRMKGAGVMTFHRVLYWLSTDIPAKSPVPDLKISSAPLKFDVSNVFNRIRVRNSDGSIPKLTYSIEKNSNPSAVSVKVDGSVVTISKGSAGKGSAVIILKATDRKWWWDDIETFKVSVVSGGALDNDGDGIADADEMNRFHTNPVLADTDVDGLDDKSEIVKYKTDPNNSDVDGDGLLDAAEMKAKTDPRRSDTDGDGVSDGLEVLKYHSNPLRKNTDGDRYPDAYEIARGMDPCSPYAPFAKYSFDKIVGGKFKDSSGQGRDLPAGAVKLDNNGKSGAAARFDGRRARLVFTDPKKTKKACGGGKAYTVSVWAKPEGTPQGPIFRTALFSIRADGRNYLYRGSAASGAPPKWGGRGDRMAKPSQVDRIIAPMRPGKWTLITVASDGKDTFLYANGSLVAKVVGVADGGFSDFYVGMGVTRRYGKWKGALDCLVIDARPYSPKEVKQLFSNPN